MCNNEELDIIELESEDGELLRLCVDRYFFYNGDEYVLLSDDCGQNKPKDEVSHYVMKVVPLEDEDGEEMEEFVPVEDELMDQLIHVVESTFGDE
ncbi:MAG: DUF1292 domain-containing protein [Clostridia bacterium]|nr:DUF1292 domain-containing protein [Clostridia bacterium]